MKRYLVVVEKAPNNYGAYIPDVDGCVATGESVEETVRLLQEALVMHFELMAEDGETIPEPTSQAAYVEVDTPETAVGKATRKAS